MQLRAIKPFVSVLLILLILSGCAFISGETQTQPASSGATTPATPSVSSLVGTWHFNMEMDIGMGLINYDIFQTYNLDGTARTTYMAGDWQTSIDFSWSASNGVLTTTDEAGNVVGSVTYSITGNTLTVHGDGSTIVLQRYR